MKLRHYIFEIAAGPDHDRLLDEFLTRAEALGLCASKSVIGASLASGTALHFEGIMPEPGETFYETVARVNRNLELLREGLDPTPPKAYP